MRIPYRVDIAGTWGDHPLINALYPQDVICASIQGKFKKGMGLSGSTRETIKKYPNKSIRELFELENKDKPFMSGSQDMIGIKLPGLKKLRYKESYWPTIKRTLNRDILDWLEKVCWLVPTIKRPKDLNVLGRLDLTRKKAKQYAKSTKRVWKAILKKDINKFGEELTENHYLLMSMIPRRRLKCPDKIITKTTPLGFKLCGAGGGGYLLIVNDKPVKNGVKFKIT